MYTLYVNGAVCRTEKNSKLLDYLRDDLRLTSVKNGCGEGACGTCTVLVDGKKAKACVFRVAKLDGKHITTVEGLTEREREVYVYAFGQTGAVQCGFCIPGMVLCAKALIAENPAPTPEDVKKAIRGNICRCTGYVRIEQAILLAAKMLRENLSVPDSDADARIGHLFPRVDVAEKVLGTGLFVDDITLPGMIYAKALRSKYPRARVEKIDLTRALAHPDVVRILTAKDVPFNKTGHIIQDWDVLIAEGDCTRYVGDAIVLVATNHKETLDEVLSLVDVTYTELTPLTDPREAMKEDAPRLHENGNILTKQVLRRGDVDKAIAEAAYVVTRHYSTPMTDHAFMEPECAIGIPDGEGGLLMYTASQSVYDEQKEISRMLKLPPEKVRCQTKLVGGGFGGKEDMSVQHHAALMAWATGRPVKVKFSRQESLQHPHQAPRHGDGRDHRLRQGRQTPGHEGAAHLRLRGLCLPGRAGFAARLHACRRSLQLPERGHHRHLRLYQQRARRRVPRLRRHAELLRGQGQPGPAGREGGHLPVGDPLPQRHPPRTGAAQRADRLAGYGLRRMPGGREGSV